MNFLFLPAGWRLIGNGWAAVPDQIENNLNYEAALKCALGDYQKSILEGYEAWSGSTLHGNAKKYSGQYHAGLANLMKRMRRAGVVFSIETIDRRRVLCIGEVNPKPVPMPFVEPEFLGTINTIADLL